jgi:hypothetical protein
MSSVFDSTEKVLTSTALPTGNTTFPFTDDSLTGISGVSGVLGVSTLFFLQADIVMATAIQSVKIFFGNCMCVFWLFDVLLFVIVKLVVYFLTTTK